ncbi:MAG: two-component sensor histidine kinase [Luteibaculaceae bacterium]|jgi:two-component sensor histidine kinase
MKIKAKFIGFILCAFTRFLGMTQSGEDLDLFRQKLSESDQWFSVNPEQSFAYLDSLKLDSEVISNPEFLLETYFKEVSFLYDLGDMINLSRIAREIEAVATKVDNKRNLSRVQLLYGLLFHRYEMLDSAAISFQKAYGFAVEVNDDVMAAKALNNMGNIYGDLGLLEKSTYMYKRAVTFRKAVGDNHGLIKCYNNIGINFTLKGLLDSAIHYSNKALEICDFEKDHSSMIIAYQNLAQSHLLKGKLGKAKGFIKMASEKSKFLPFYQVSTLKIWGGILFEDKQYNKSKEVFLEAIELADSLSMTSAKLEIYGGLSEVFIKLGDLALAVEAMKRHADVRYGQLTQEQLSNIKDVSRNWEIQENEKTIRNLVEENDRQKKDLDQFAWLRILTIIFLVFLGGVLVVFGTRMRMRGKMNAVLKNRVKERTAELEQQFEEKSLMLRELHHRVKNNMQLILSFLRLQRHFLDNTNVENVIEEAIARIQSMATVHEELYSSKGWSDSESHQFFENYIPQVVQALHPDPEQLQVKIELETMDWKEAEWIPLSLILNEWLSNGIKYAYTVEEDHRFDIKMFHRGGYRVVQYRDYGIGMKGDPKKGLGLTIVEGLANQLSAEIVHLDTDSGTCLELIL